jgi:DNA-binding NarL/FixJ family response regulator
VLRGQRYAHQFRLKVYGHGQLTTYARDALKRHLPNSTALGPERPPGFAVTKSSLSKKPSTRTFQRVACSSEVATEHTCTQLNYISGGNVKFLIIDDDFGSRGGMIQTLRDHYPNAELFEASSLQESKTILEKEPNIQLTLVDLNLSDSRGMNTLQEIKQWCEDHECNPRLIIVSAAADYDEKIIVQAIENCATGFIAKGTSINVFKSAIDLTLAGSIYIPESYLRVKKIQKINKQDESPFTPREKQVAALLIQGFSYKQIARKLENEDGKPVAENTIRAHVQHIAWKLRVAPDGMGDSLSAKAAVLTAFAAKKLTF